MKIEPYFSSLGVRLHISIGLLSLHPSLSRKKRVKILIVGEEGQQNWIKGWS